VKTYRVGIIGFGFIGKVHAYGYASLPYYYDPVPLSARITHVVTSQQATAEKARQVLGAEVAAIDFRAVTEEPTIDIVHICTPNHLHKDALLSAMAHGKHIYCDKPLVATAAEAAEVRAALGQYRGTAQMTFQNRFFPATLRAKQLLEEGKLGTVLEFRLLYLHGGNVDPSLPMKWKLTAASGGGVIADLASHALDLVEWLCGPIGSLSALTHTAYAFRPAPHEPARLMPVDAEDCVMAMVRLRSGGVGLLEATKLATGTEDELVLEVHGTRGAIRFSLMRPHYLAFFDTEAAGEPLGGHRGWTWIATGQRYPHPASSFPSPKASIGWLRGHVACLANFLQAVAEGRPATPGLEAGLRVQDLMECLRRSAASGQWVEC
jgi:predicted dehydrogenase